MDHVSKKIEGSELQHLIAEANRNADVISFIAQMVKHNVIQDREQSTVLDSIAYQPESAKFVLLILGFRHDRVKIIYTKADANVEVKASVLSMNGDKEILTGYRIVNGRIEVTSTTEYTQQFQERVREISEKNSLPTGSRADVSIQAPCLYGNWCGPGCSGPGAPISAVDSCCKSHDNCYGSRGYFACSCDYQLHDCLYPYAAAGSAWAILFISWYSWPYICNPFA